MHVVESKGEMRNAEWTLDTFNKHQETKNTLHINIDDHDHEPWTEGLNTQMEWSTEQETGA